MVDVILACGGNGSRAGLGYNKLKFNIGGMTVLEKTLTTFSRNDIDTIFIPCSAEDREWISDIAASSHLNIVLCNSGKTRSGSVWNALQQIKSCDTVLIHDGARPFVSQNLIDKVISETKLYGNAIPALACTDSLRQIYGAENDCVTSRSVERKDYVRVQTPQGFAFSQLFLAYQKAMLTKKEFSDDASLYEHFVGAIHLCDGEDDNIKLTYPSDFHRFFPTSFSVGVGWDTHKLVPDRKLVIGGLKIPHTKGLLGHSDADVLLHAIMDALLSASSNRDIGCLFPDTDSNYKGIDSALLVRQVIQLIHSQGYIIKNISAVIMAQQPKLKEYICAMQKNIAELAEIPLSCVSLSATTTEKLGLIGHEEAISSNAYCSLYKINN